PLFVAGNAIELVKTYKFVGVIFTSTERNIFTEHYLTKVSKARNSDVANATFAAKTNIGCLPPADGIRLYMA
ncbi:hypothetical protein C8J57DRAFT_956045, partial [Mycena rebaudengoi]